MLRERHTLSLVCKGFLSVVRRNAHFWSTVHIWLDTPPSFIYKSLTRARDALLNMHISASHRSMAEIRHSDRGHINASFYLDTLPAISSAASHVRTLSIRCDTHSQWRAIMAVMTGAEVLQSLTIVVLSSYGGSGDHLPVPFPSIHLRTLRISRLDFIAGFPYQGLANLHLSGLHNVSWGKLVTVFRQTPNLESLQLLGVSVLDLNTSRTVTLGMLRCLVVVYRSESLATALGCINMPALHSIRLDIHWTMSALPLIAEFRGLGQATLVDIDYFGDPDVGILLSSLRRATYIDFIRSSPIVASLVKGAVREGMEWVDSVTRTIRINGCLSEDEAKVILARARNVCIISLPPSVSYSQEWDTLYTFTSSYMAGEGVVQVHNTEYTYDEFFDVWYPPLTYIL
ncbi:hypothetical protein B0H11DRAFT_2251294 [Mycena galericulata]|nr:hypothetical protein B0H11DRAFT_2251294 [Mycena galericulata]